jgi:hypothetical protein
VRSLSIILQVLKLCRLQTCCICGLLRHFSAHATLHSELHDSAVTFQSRCKQHDRAYHCFEESLRSARKIFDPSARFNSFFCLQPRDGKYGNWEKPAVKSTPGVAQQQEHMRTLVNLITELKVERSLRNFLVSDVSAARKYSRVASMVCRLNCEIRQM